MPDILLFEAIHTQRAIRHFSSDPVPDEAIDTLLQAAIRAPSGTNQQPWYFMVIRDPDTKRRIGQVYREAYMARAGTMPAGQPGSFGTQMGRDLAATMGTAPVMLFACIRRGAGGAEPSFSAGASIYPAVQNILLAARALGLGTCLTTIYKSRERDVAEILGIPEDIETAALIPVGYPAEGYRFGGSRRKPVEEVTFYERWGQTGTNG